MPKMRNLSVSDSEIPFKNYTIIKDDFSDLEEKILWLLEEERYKKQAQLCFDDYQENHQPDIYFEYYYNKILKYANL